VRAECNELKQLATQYDASQLPAIQALCAHPPHSTAGRNKWLLSADSRLRDLYGRIPCDGCLRVDLPPTQPLPSNLSSYSIFLVPSLSTEEKSSAAPIKVLRTEFEAFGDAIGDQRAAIWLKPAPYPSPAALAEESVALSLHYVDVLRSKDYCDRFGLNYNDGPYVVTTQVRPDLVTPKDKRVVIRLGGLSDDDMQHVLNLLEQDLRQAREIRQRQLLYEEVKDRLFEMAKLHPEIAKTIVGFIAGS